MKRARLITTSFDSFVARLNAPLGTTTTTTTLRNSMLHMPSAMQCLACTFCTAVTSHHHHLTV